MREVCERTTAKNLVMSNKEAFKFWCDNVMAQLAHGKNGNMGREEREEQKGRSETESDEDFEGDVIATPGGPEMELSRKEVDELKANEDKIDGTELENLQKEMEMERQRQQKAEEARRMGKGPWDMKYEEVADRVEETVAMEEQAAMSLLKETEEIWAVHSLQHKTLKGAVRGKETAINELFKKGRDMLRERDILRKKVFNLSARILLAEKQRNKLQEESEEMALKELSQAVHVRKIEEVRAAIGAVIEKGTAVRAMIEDAKARTILSERGCQTEVKKVTRATEEIRELAETAREDWRKYEWEREREQKGDDEEETESSEEPAMRRRDEDPEVDTVSVEQWLEEDTKEEGPQDMKGRPFKGRPRRMMDTGFTNVTAKVLRVTAGRDFLFAKIMTPAEIANQEVSAHVKARYWSYPDEGALNERGCERCMPMLVLRREELIKGHVVTDDIREGRKLKIVNWASISGEPYPVRLLCWHTRDCRCNTMEAQRVRRVIRGSIGKRRGNGRAMRRERW